MDEFYSGPWEDGIRHIFDEGEAWAVSRNSPRPRIQYEQLKEDYLDLLHDMLYVDVADRVTAQTALNRVKEIAGEGGGLIVNDPGEQGWGEGQGGG